METQKAKGIQNNLEQKEHGGRRQCTGLNLVVSVTWNPGPEHLLFATVENIVEKTMPRKVLGQNP